MRPVIELEIAADSKKFTRGKNRAFETMSLPSIGCRERSKEALEVKNRPAAMAVPRVVHQESQRSGENSMNQHQAVKFPRTGLRGVKLLGIVTIGALALTGCTTTSSSQATV